MASSDRHSPLHRAPALSPHRTRVATVPAWRRMLPAADTMFALFAIAAALAVFADYAATF